MEDEASLDPFIIIRSNAHKMPLMHAQKNRLHHGRKTPLPSWFPVSPPAEMEDEAANKRIRVEAGLDFFNLLPDEMLHTIIGFLPTKFGMRTTVLSKRWRFLWRSVPLDLTVDDGIGHMDHERLTAVPTSSPRTLDQSNALPSKVSVPTTWPLARSTNGSNPPPYMASRRSWSKVGYRCSLCRDL